MKKVVAIIAGLAFAAVLSVQAADKAAKPQLTPEQKQLRKEMMQKYDTNGDKKLDKDELAKVSAEDKDKYEKAGIWPKAKKSN
jgi:hypothetical protein